MKIYTNGIYIYYLHRGNKDLYLYKTYIIRYT